MYDMYESHTCDNMNESHTFEQVTPHREDASQERGGVSEEDMSCDMHDSHHIQLKTSCHTNSDVPSAKGDNRNESSYTHI